MRLAVLSDSIHLSATGIGRFVLGLVIELRKRGHYIILVDAKEKPYLLQYADEVLVLPPRVQFLELGLWHLDVVRRLQKSRTRYDAIISPSSLPNFFGDLSKCLWIGYDLSEIKHSKTFQAGLLRNIYARLFLPRCLKKSGAVGAISLFTLRELEAFLGAPMPHACVLYPGPSPRFTENSMSPPNSLIAKVIRDEIPFILFVGTIQPRKNLARLVAAFEIARRDIPRIFRLVIAGSRGWKCRTSIETITSSPFKGDIIELGYVTESELELLYDKAAGLAYPSLYEGFGLPVLDAMLRGCPVVTSINSSMSEIGGETAYYCDPLDVQSIASALLKLVESDNVESITRDRAISRASKFTWPACVESLESHIRKHITT